MDIHLKMQLVNMFMLVIMGLLYSFLGVFLHHQSSVTYGNRRDKTCLRGFENNKGADKPAHLGRLVRAIVICVLESIISRLVLSEISLF